MRVSIPGLPQSMWAVIAKYLSWLVRVSVHASSGTCHSHTCTRCLALPLYSCLWHDSKNIIYQNIRHKIGSCKLKRLNSFYWRGGNPSSSPFELTNKPLSLFGFLPLAPSSKELDISFYPGQIFDFQKAWAEMVSHKLNVVDRPWLAQCARINKGSCSRIYM